MPIRDYIGLILSIVVIGSLYWGCSFEIQQVVMRELLMGPGGKYQFLTILNMYLQIFYFILCIINFFIGSNTVSLEQRSIVQKFRDYVFAAAVFPIGTFVGLSFWGIYHFDRKLIFAKELDLIISPTLNHVMHTLPAVGIWLENLVHYHRYPSRLAGLLCVLGISGAYIGWIHYLYHLRWVRFQINVWIYPILNELPVFYRCLFFLGSTLFIIGLYLIGEMYTRFLTSLRFDKSENNKKKL